MTRVPIGISSASEIFQRKMEELLEGLNGVECYQDDIIVHGRTVEEHDSILLTVLQRIKESGLKLNKQRVLCDPVDEERDVGDVLADPVRIGPLVPGPMLDVAFSDACEESVEVVPIRYQ